MPMQALKLDNSCFAELKIPKANFMVKKASSGQFTCGKCGRSYMRKDSLQRHLRWECGKEPLFQCPFCPQRCKRKPHWLRHIRRQHRERISDIENDLIAYTPKMAYDWKNINNTDCIFCLSLLWVFMTSILILFFLFVNSYISVMDCIGDWYGRGEN